jgi:tRNA pseudouridine55 synthase
MAKQRESGRSGVNGFLNFNKPVGLTSMDGLRHIKRITGQRQKVGHAGTMDPLAHGVLPICFGQATRLMDYVLDGVKRYQVEIELGATTATYDAEGEVTRTGDPAGITPADVLAALPAFIGVIQQTPPMYSAIKVDGQRLYKLARAGIEVERKSRTVEIYDIQLVHFASPRVVLSVECGRGVYIRSLAHDLGQMLGCGGYVTDLVRQYSGGFALEQSVTLEQLEAAAAAEPGGWQQYLHPVDWALRDLRSITVSASAEQYLRHGQPVTLGRADHEAGYLEQYRTYTAQGVFLALVRYDRPANLWRPVKVFQLEQPSPYAPSATPA